MAALDPIEEMGEQGKRNSFTIGEKRETIDNQNLIYGVEIEMLMERLASGQIETKMDAVAQQWTTEVVVA